SDVRSPTEQRGSQSQRARPPHRPLSIRRGLDSGIPLPPCRIGDVAQVGTYTTEHETRRVELARTTDRVEVSVRIRASGNSGVDECQVSKRRVERLADGVPRIAVVLGVRNADQSRVQAIGQPVPIALLRRIENAVDLYEAAAVVGAKRP